MLACVRGGGGDLVEVGPEQVKDEADVTPAKSHRQYGNCQYSSNVQVWVLVSVSVLALISIRVGIGISIGVSMSIRNHQMLEA